MGFGGVLWVLSAAAGRKYSAGGICGCKRCGAGDYGLPQPVASLFTRSAAWGETVQASPRTALILHRQDGEYPVLHSKPHVFSGKGQAIDPLRVLLIPGPGIAGQHAH